jgi:hypothetical protein
MIRQVSFALVAALMLLDVGCAGASPAALAIYESSAKELSQDGQYSTRIDVTFYQDGLIHTYKKTINSNRVDKAFEIVRKGQTIVPVYTANDQKYRIVSIELKADVAAIHDSEEKEGDVVELRPSSGASTDATTYNYVVNEKTLMVFTYGANQTQMDVLSMGTSCTYVSSPGAPLMVAHDGEGSDFFVGPTQGGKTRIIWKSGDGMPLWGYLVMGTPLRAAPLIASINEELLFGEGGPPMSAVLFPFIGGAPAN